MAEKGESDNLSYSQLNATDEYHTLCCTRCAKDRRNKPSVKYCTTCCEYFCKDCLKSHNSFPVMAKHPTVDTDTLGNTSKTTGDEMYAVPTEFCPRHPLKVIEMYCRSEDIVGCSVCFNLEHKSCNDIHYITKYVVNNNPTRTIRKVHQKLGETEKNIDDLETKLNKFDGEFEKNKSECKQAIKQYRKEINDAIDDIERRTLAELEREYNRCRQNKITQSKTIQEMKSDLKRYRSDLESEQINLSQKFVLAIMGQTLIKQTDTIGSRTTENQTSTPQFRRNTDILAFLLNVLTLGLISSPGHQDNMETSSRDKQTNQPAFTTTTTTTTGATGSSVGIGNVRKVSQSKKQGLYKVVNKSEHNITQSDDKTSCSIWSSCIVDDSCIVLADYSNKKLKLVDSKTYNIISSLVLDAAPRSVCRLDSGGVVVGLNNNTLQFVSYKDKLVVTRTLGIEHNCICITVCNNNMFVSSTRELYIYNLQGKSLKSFTEIKSGNKTFSNISDVTISDDYSMIHIVDYNSGIITLDMNGKIFWEFSDKVLRAASGVCTDGSGNVLVCGALSYNVIMLGPGGDYIGEIVTRQDGLISPFTVCYDKNRNTLIVGGICDNIKVFSLQ